MPWSVNRTQPGPYNVQEELSLFTFHTQWIIPLQVTNSKGTGADKSYLSINIKLNYNLLSYWHLTFNWYKSDLWLQKNFSQ